MQTKEIMSKIGQFTRDAGVTLVASTAIAVGTAAASGALGAVVNGSYDDHTHNPGEVSRIAAQGNAIITPILALVLFSLYKFFPRCVTSAGRAVPAVGFLSWLILGTIAGYLLDLVADNQPSMELDDVTSDVGVGLLILSIPLCICCCACLCAYTSIARSSYQTIDERQTNDEEQGQPTSTTRLNNIN